MFKKFQGQKPFECEVCKQRFVTKCNLVNHEWQHKQVRQRPYKCQLCRKAYLRQNLLDAHMRSHRGVKPFVCNECGLQFANKSNWQRHVAEHSGARNFCCPRCDKRFQAVLDILLKYKCQMVHYTEPKFIIVLMNSRI